MAIQKDIKLASGITINYHKVGDVKLNCDCVKSVVCSVESYLDATTRTAGNIPVVRGAEIFRITNEEAESNIVALCYDKLKTLEKYRGATDLL